jgi:hypothetical protein
MDATLRSVFRQRALGAREKIQPWLRQAQQGLPGSHCSFVTLRPAARLMILDKSRRASSEARRKWRRLLQRDSAYAACGNVPGGSPFYSPASYS